MRKMSPDKVRTEGHKGRYESPSNFDFDPGNVNIVLSCRFQQLHSGVEDIRVDIIRNIKWAMRDESE